MRKILLNSKKSKNDVNNINIIPIEFNRDYSLFQDEKKTETLDILQLYNDEKNESSKHRLIFTINPICTNILFNRITEIVYKEGSDECQWVDGNKEFNDAIGIKKPTRNQAIKNTEYSNNKFNLTYHCGIDIFNNHLLRKKDNISIQKVDKSKIKDLEDIEKKFNTIEDYSRTYNGIILNEYNLNTNRHPIFDFNNSPQRSNVYNYDTINSFENAFKDNLSRSNGWLGFYNPSTLHIPVSGEISENNAYYVNKCINNMEPCQFIDMAPERDLFSFTPKKNLYRHRLENNWDYCLTYPYKCDYGDTNGFNILRGYGKGLPLFFVTEYNNSSSVPFLLFYSPVKHNLNVGDRVKMTYDDNKSQEQICTIIRVGDFDNKNNDNYFSIRKSNLFDDVNNKDVNKVTNFRFSKLVNGYECNYYFRKFKKIKNQDNEQPKSVINKLAFAKNIYNDDISQIVFTEDIDVNNLNDNLGRPLTELYLTIIKRNKGYKEWYKENKYSGNSIEYSHVFGEVTSGLDISMLEKSDNINYPAIRMQHNITNMELISSQKIESDITIDNMDEFYGDLIEFNPIMFKETILEPIMYRFNTAQREIYNPKYSAVTYDEINGENGDGSLKINVLTITGNTLDPEGYIYKPHHKVKIGEFSDIVKQKNNIRLWVLTSGRSSTRHLITSVQYDIVCNDTIILFGADKKPRLYTVKKYGLNSNGKWEIEFTEELNLNNIDNESHSNDSKNFNWDNFFVFMLNREVPKHAYFFPTKTGLVLWRDYVKPSNYPYNSDLYSIPFTNGSFYHHSNITFPVQRQDPDNEYRRHLFKDDDSYETNNKFYISSSVKPIDFDDDYVLSSFNGVCF